MNNIKLIFKICDTNKLKYLVGLNDVFKEFYYKQLITNGRRLSQIKLTI